MSESEKTKLVYYLATSLDGYIATATGNVDWLDELSIEGEGSGYEAFYRSIDGLIMGRGTYDFVHNYGQWPYDEKPAWVCTSSDVPPLSGCNLQDEREPLAAIEAATALGCRNIWLVGGGVLAASMLKEGLLTDISVSVMPVVLGGGIRLIDSLPAHVHLQQKSSMMMAGFTQIEYEVVSP